jgi:hypothetical protein
VNISHYKHSNTKNICNSGRSFGNRRYRTVWLTNFTKSHRMLCIVMMCLFGRQASRAPERLHIDHNCNPYSERKKLCRGISRIVFEQINNCHNYMSDLVMDGEVGKSSHWYPSDDAGEVYIYEPLCGL